MRIDLVKTDVSEERVVSILRLQKSASKKQRSSRLADSFYLDDGSGTSLRNVGLYKLHTAPHPRIRHSS
jgi:hypothetical protein